MFSSNLVTQVGRDLFKMDYTRLFDSKPLIFLKNLNSLLNLDLKIKSLKNCKDFFETIIKLTCMDLNLRSLLTKICL